MQGGASSQEKKTVSKEQSDFERMPNDVLCHITTQLCSRPMYDVRGVRSAVKGLREQSRACRAAVNSSVKHVTAPSFDIWNQEEEAPEQLPSTYTGVTALDLTRCTIRQATSAMAHCLRTVHRFKNLVKLRIGPSFVSTRAATEGCKGLYALLSDLPLPRLNDLEIRLGIPNEVGHWGDPLQIREFTRYTTLKTLRFCSGEWRDADVEHLSSFTTLTALHLHDCHNTFHRALRYVGGLTRLQQLSLAHNCDLHALPCACLSLIKTLSELTCLNLSYSTVHNQDLVFFTTFRRLRVLLLEGTAIYDTLGQGEHPKACDALAELTTLTALNIRDTHCAQGVHKLSCLTRLGQLHIGGTRLPFSGCSDAGLLALTGLGCLTRLQVPNNPSISRVGLEAIACLTALLELDLMAVPCQDSDLFVLSALTNLRVLALDNWLHPLGHVFRKLVSGPSLRLVSFNGSDVKSTVLDELEHLPDAQIRQNSRGAYRYRFLEIGSWSRDSSHGGIAGHPVLHTLRNRTALTEW